jgi:hypothetical protein
MNRAVYIFLLFFALLPFEVSAQERDTAQLEGKYLVEIDFGRGYAGGICVMKWDGSSLNASLFNEFGVSVLVYKYEPAKGKVKIMKGAGPLGKGKIKRVIRRNLEVVMSELDNKDYTYIDPKTGITYKFRPLDYETVE